MDETVSYQPHPEDKTRTLLKQEAVVTVQGIPLNSYMEDLLTSTIMVNANKVQLLYHKVQTLVRLLALARGLAQGRCVICRHPPLTRIKLVIFIVQFWFGGMIHICH